VIDCHSHYLPSELERVLERQETAPRLEKRGDNRFVVYEGGAYLLPVVRTVEKLDQMDDAGIETTVLSVNLPGIDWAPSADARPLARAVNDELAALVAEEPRFEALAVLPMQEPAAAADELERSSALGLSGAIVFSNVNGHPLDEPAFEPVFEAAARTATPLLLHPTHPALVDATDTFGLASTVGFVVEPTLATLRLIFSGTFERHPVRLVLGHAGGLFPYLMPRLRHFYSGTQRDALEDALGRIYVDTVCGSGAVLALALQCFGPERILVGTDHPFWDMRESLSSVADLDVPAEEMRRIHEANAVELFRLA
jgi:predicted TIM-barrel fold metal-dependent hydrolase